MKNRKGGQALSAARVIIMLVAFVMLLLHGLENEQMPRIADRVPIRLDYHVVVREGRATFHVTATFSNVPLGQFLLAMTANYGKVKKVTDVISDVVIRSGRRTIVWVDTVSDFAWNVTLSDSSGLKIEYDVNAQYPYSTLNMVRLPYRDSDHLYFPAASVFIHPEEESLARRGLTIGEISVRFALPPHWQAVTSWGMGKLAYHVEPPSLVTLNNGLVGVGNYRTYVDSLVHSPLSIAILNRGSVRTDNGTTRTITDEEITSTVRAAFESGTKIFGFSPVSRYTSLVHFVLDHPGQVHGNAIGWTTNVNYGRLFDKDRWIEAKSHVFSEIFHLWNGTEGAPLSRSQADTSTIWFTEGVTHFYRLKNMFTSGIIPENEYFDMMAKEFSTVHNNPRGGDDLDVLSSGYYADRSAMKLTYSKGACVAFALDVLLQHTSDGRKRFDDVMKAVLDRFDYRITKRGFSAGELDSVLADMLEEKHYASYRKIYGARFSDEFRSIMERSGIHLKAKEGRKLIFGVTNFARSSDPPYVVDEIDRHSPAFRAGLRESDILFAIDGRIVLNKGDLKAHLEGVKEGQKVNLTVVRSGRQVVIRTPWSSNEQEFALVRQ